jgi:hypothetical protein
MGLARTTLYDQPRSAADDTAIVEEIVAICSEFEHYGWRFEPLLCHPEPGTGYEDALHQPKPATK